MNITTDIKSIVEKKHTGTVITTGLELFTKTTLSPMLCDREPRIVEEVKRKQEAAFKHELFGPLLDVIEELTYLAMKNAAPWDSPYGRIQQLRGKAMDHMAMAVEMRR